MNLSDTHNHFYTDAFDEDRDYVVQRAVEQGVKRFFLPNIDSGYTDRLVQMNQKYPDLTFPMMGLHPCSVKEDYREELKRIENDLFNPSRLGDITWFGVGEIGLDLYWDKSFFAQQQEAFRVQCEWAKELGLPIIIHVREAFDEIFDLVDELNDDRLFGIFHCFTGNEAQAQHILEYGGFKLGIGGVLTFKNSGLDKVVKNISLEHLVLETDSPYLAPHPYRGKRNEPSYTSIVAQKLADIKEVDISVVAEQTERNTNEIFRL
ncbi:TatD family hydrolase [bacterium SCSIO 12741]|nr:TatD family hydrolase [bacterium SCSIO 12741]